jgi:hypothetical protein
MWVQVRVEVTRYVQDPSPDAHLDPETGVLTGTVPPRREEGLSGTMWARSEDLPPVTPEKITPVSAYKRTVQVHVGDDIFSERVYRLHGAWSPEAGKLLADKFEEVAAVPR